MAIKLFINFLDSEQNLFEKIDFFCLSGKLCCDDLELIRKTSEILNLLKPNLIETTIHIETTVKDPSAALMQLKSQIKYESSVYREKLSLREIDVIGLIMQGLSNKEIAEKLFISFETVKTHRKNIFRKTGVTNAASLINYYNQAFKDPAL